MKKWITLTLILALILYVGCSSSNKPAPTPSPRFRGSKWLSTPEEVIKGENVELQYQTFGEKVCPKVLYGITSRDTVWYGFQNDSLAIAGYRLSSMWGSMSIDALIDDYIITDSELVKKYGPSDSAYKIDSIRTSINAIPGRNVTYSSIRYIGDVTLLHTLTAFSITSRDRHLIDEIAYRHYLTYQSKWYRETERF